MLDVSIFKPVELAFDTTGKILFRTFNIVKWPGIGFTLPLAVSLFYYLVSCVVCSCYLYLRTVALLPLYVFFRNYSLHFLGQFGGITICSTQPCGMNRHDRNQ